MFNMKIQEVDESLKLKAESQILEHTDQSDNLEDPDSKFSEEERRELEKKLVRKLDRKIIPWLSLLYLISFLDRANVGNARLYGLQEDIGHISDSQYNLGLTVFFISYSLIEPLTNILLKKLRPKIFIPIIMISWAICLMSIGLVSNFRGFVTARFFLGLTEAGLFPGVNYYLSCWYKRSELGVRIAIFFSAAAVAGSFGGLLAAAIALMDGVGGKPGWAWIFILEGLATILVGILSYWMVHDFPDEATFLTAPERLRALRRLRDDEQASGRHEEFSSLFVWQALKDWKTYLYMIIYGGSAGSLYAFSLFLPSIIKELGYTSSKANLLSVPPYAAAALLTIAVGWYADRTSKRGLCNIFVSLLGVTGFTLLIACKDPRVKYAATYLAALGIYPTIANTITWVSNNVEGVYKRGVVLGMVIGWGNLNGVMGSSIYLKKDGPQFIAGHSVVLGYIVVFLFGGSLITTIFLRQENSKRLDGRRNAWTDNITAEEGQNLGDMRFVSLEKTATKHTNLP